MESKPISANRPKNFEVSSLRLDNLNPRLPSEVESYSQVDLLMYMEERFDLLPIARSMSDNGYFDEEPLIIIPKEDESETFIVVEGNRRLAALKFLTNPELRARSDYKEIYQKLAVDAKENLMRIPAVLYGSRPETARMLGFRHITGIRKWPAYDKARFVHKFVQDYGDLTFSEIARILGDKTHIIRKDYAMYRVYLQARASGIDTTALEDDYSVFTTALGRLAFQRFIGIQIRGKTVEQLENPVPDERNDQLNEIITWVHGTEDTDPIIRESRDLRNLAAVLESPEALRYLRSGGKLADAYSLTAGEEQSVINSINKASFHIEESLRFLHRHKTNPTIRDAFYRCAQSLRQALNHFPDIWPEVSTESE